MSGIAQSSHRIHGVLCAAGILLLVASAFAGSVPIGIDALGDWVGSSREGFIFWELRAPRVALAFCVGAILSLGGLVFQTCYQNPLASPYTLGVVSGASLGACIASYASTVWLEWFPPVSMFAFLGAMSVLTLELFIARRGLRIEGTELVLLGVMLSAIFSSLTLLVEYFMTPNDLARSSRWLMGSVETVGFRASIILAPVALTLASCAYRWRAELDLIYLGEELARSRGLDYSRSLLRWYLVVAFAIAVAVAACGPIGFVGILIPHFTRQFFGGRPSASVLPATFWGGVFLVSCDALARSLMAPIELPVGIITALLGGPAFLVVMLREKRR